MNKKVIFKNTLFLYFRLVFTLLISLFTSRVILLKLGIEDFGLYSLVAGVVALMSFMQTTLSSATSRFLNFEMVNSNLKKLNIVFNSAYLIHILLSILVLLIAETIGLWFIYNKVNVPFNKLSTAISIYHISVITIIIQILALPYYASILANEKMKVFAYLGLVDVILKLLIVYLLDLFDYNKLIIYSVLLLIVNFIISLTYMLYCIRNFKETCLKWIFDKNIIKEIFSFFSWDLFGNFSVVIRNQGVTILQNNFFGLAINTATTISMQVLSGITGFSNNFLLALKPSIIKYYASNEVEKMEKMVIKGAVISYYLMLLFSLPFIFNIDFILKVWLKNVPEYTNIFCQIALISNLFSVLFRTLMFSIHATGKMKRISFYNGTLYILVLPISYLFLKNNGSPIVAPLINGVLLLIGCFLNLYTVKKYIPNFNIDVFLFQAILKPISLTLFIISFPLLYKINSNESLYSFIISTLICLISSIVFIYLLGIDKESKNNLKIRIKKFKSKIIS